MTARTINAAARSTTSGTTTTTREETPSMALLHNLATVPPLPAPLPCDGTCQVAAWQRKNSWCCPAYSDHWICSREEGHPGPHIACAAHSDNPGHHRLHVWPTSAPVMACCGGILSDHADWCPLVARVVDRHGDRYVTGGGERRERATRCRRCGDPDVWALDRLCDLCAVREAEAA